VNFNENVYSFTIDDSTNWILHNSSKFPWRGIYSGYAWTTKDRNLWFVDEELKGLFKLQHCLFSLPCENKWEEMARFKHQISERKDFVLWPLRFSYGSFHIFGGQSTDEKLCHPELHMYEHNIGWTLLSNISQKPNFQTLPLTPGCRKSSTIVEHNFDRLLCLFGGSNYSDVWCFDKIKLRWHWYAGHHSSHHTPFEHSYYGTTLPGLIGSSSWLDHLNRINMFGGSHLNNSVYYNLIWTLSKQVIHE
jgi:hypothetical protein